jgi:excinuclease UvrABC nuclease subunit
MSGPSRSREDAMGKKTVRLNPDSIAKLPNDKPVVYRIIDRKGQNIYTGTAGKGNVRSRVADHLPRHKDPVPGAVKVQIDQQPSISDAKKKEANIISRSKPKYNRQGK